MRARSRSVSAYGSAMRARNLWTRRCCVACFGAIGTLNVALAQEVCGSIDAHARFLDASVTSVKAVASSGEPRLPTYCEVDVRISPEPGSRIGAVYRLPAEWNGKVLGIGGGGFAGNLGLDAASEGLVRGYATMQNDMGHAGASALNPDFALLPNGEPNVPGIVDFGHRATHLATLVGKAVVEAVYGRAPEHAYWQGCSTGGRQGLAELQRYPDDYDGVIAGAPVYTPLTYSNAMLRVQAFHKDPASNLRPEHVALIHNAVLDACDADDGVTDGILTDPRTCRWDPAELECKSRAPSPSCLTTAQVETVRRIYAGVKTSDGRFAAMPLMRGGEADWGVRMIGNADLPLGLNARLGGPFMGYIVKADPNYDILSFDPEREMAALAGGIAGREIHAMETDISPFVARDGKLLLWHGFNDPGPSPLSTIEYYESVLDDTPSAADSVRLFLLPGVLHCRGGPGPDRFDALDAIERWVEHDEAPATMIATKTDAELSRPLCPYPALPRYTGAGNPDAATSFECATDDN
jgi:Tannase and feruloyl esterase